jgi:hypothetical protein
MREKNKGGYTLLKFMLEYSGVLNKKYFNPFVTSRTYIPHLKESFQVRWDNSIPLCLHAAIYLEVSLFR